MRVLGLDVCNGSWRGQLSSAMLCTHSGDSRWRGFCSVRHSAACLPTRQGNRGPRGGEAPGEPWEPSPSSPLAREPHGRPGGGGKGPQGRSTGSGSPARWPQGPGTREKPSQRGRRLRMQILEPSCPGHVPDVRPWESHFSGPHFIQLGSYHFIGSELRPHDRVTGPGGEQRGRNRTCRVSTWGGLRTVPSSCGRETPTGLQTCMLTLQCVCVGGAVQNP